MTDDDDDAPAIHKAKIDDEFLKHPGSGALIRNPFREKGRTLPILFSRGEYEHNSLDEALQEWQTVTISEAGFRDMVNSWSAHHNGSAILPSAVEIDKSRTAGRSWRSPASWCNTRQRAAVGKLRELPNGFEFSVHLKKSSYTAPRTERRTRGKEGGHQGRTIVLDKIGIDASDDKGMHLRVEAIQEGHILVWNRAHPSFVVKVGDLIVRANDRGNSTAALLEEMSGSHETLRLTVRRSEHPNAKSLVPLKARTSTGMEEIDTDFGEGLKLPSPNSRVTPKETPRQFGSKKNGAMDSIM